MDEVLKVELDQMVKKQDSLEKARQMKRNLEDMHMKIWESLNSKLAKKLKPLLEVPSADIYQWWFYLMLDPLYVNEFRDFRKLHEIETVDTSTITNKIMPKFYDYIVMA